MSFLKSKRLAVTVLMLIPLAACYAPYDNDRVNSREEAIGGDGRVGEVRGDDPNCYNCGYVEAIEEVTVDGESTGLGAVIGAVLGGVAGNQVGGGTGRDAATAAGAVGGAVAGKEIEERRNADVAYDVVVDLDNGGDEVVTVADASDLSVGTYVEIDEGNLIIQE